jgi:DNA polymerase-4
MFKALKLCPQAVVIKPDFAKYRAESARIMAKLSALTPLVQPLSLDEAWLDLTGCERLHGAPAAGVLARVQNEIEAEVGITVSVGLSSNKFLAKIASDLDNPRGFSVIGGEEAQAFLAPRPVSILPGVGPAMARALEGTGWRTVGDLARADPKALSERFGAYGLRLFQLARGQDARAVDPEQHRKGISAETTFESDHADVQGLEDRLWPLCERVARTCRKEGVSARAVVLKLKTPDFRLITRRRTLPIPTQTARSLFAVARELLAGEADGRAFRLIGVGVQDLAEASDAGEDLFGSHEARALKNEQAVDVLRARFGSAAVLSGRALKPRPREE